MDRSRIERILTARRQRLEAEEKKGEIPALVESLRGFYHPKQRAFFCGKHKRKATKKTRRAGATSGGVREFLARAFETPGFRATYVTTTRDEAKERAWENDTKTGFADVVRLLGTPIERTDVETVAIAGVRVEIRVSDLALEFSNGSRIDLFGANHLGALGKKRGTSKHVFWIDEAQDFPNLDVFYKAVVVGSLTDFKGECWVTGTPGTLLIGFFYDLTRDDVEERLPGWEVHEIAVVDNPYFGRPIQIRDVWHVQDNLQVLHGPYEYQAAASEAAVRIRWENTAGAAIRDNGWAEDDPDLLREWFARWVKEGAKYVYAVHSVPEHTLIYAPQRLGPDGFPDIKKALLDLPGKVDEDRDYFLALGADLGTRAAFAFVMWAWSLMDPILYEVCSWKRAGLDYDEMAEYLHMVRRQAVIGMIVADAGGGGKPAVMGWSKQWVKRYSLPIVEATKPNKVVTITQMNNDIRKGHLKLRSGSPWLAEAKVHLWAPQRSDKGGLVEGTKTPHDCLDGGRYVFAECYHHRFRPESLTPDPGSPEYIEREERELEESAFSNGESDVWA